MALFVDLEDDDVEPPRDIRAGKPVWTGDMPAGNGSSNGRGRGRGGAHGADDREEAHEPEAAENPNRDSPVTRALGCYPIVIAVASSIDLNALDSLSRTCRQARAALLQYRRVLLASTLRCVNEPLPVDAEETLRYRARAGNWYYMEDLAATATGAGRAGRGAGQGYYGGKSGRCARDMVSECRRCGTVVCRNCAIKPPAPIVLRDRHRRLCVGCARAPLGSLAKPPLPPDTPLDSPLMQRAICTCASEAVWLCQPCGRSIRSADHDYQAIWRWRNQYGEVLGGLGTGIGEGDRGVICGREDACCCAKEREQETDCDAEDAREAEGVSTPGPSAAGGATATPPPPQQQQQQQQLTLALTPAGSSLSIATPPPWNGPDGGGGGGGGGIGDDNGNARRTPSPALLGPGYARHEIEGIGGVVKRKRVRMVRVGACVPEWEDEKARGEVLGREVSGRVRSWCGWCYRPIPGRKDYEAAAAAGKAGKAGKAEKA